MSPQAKTNTKYIITTISAIMTLSVFAFSLGVGFKQNAAEHEIIQLEQAVMQADLESETIRSKTIDAERSKSMHKIQIDIEVMKNRDIQQSITQQEIKEVVKDIQSKL